MIVLESREGYGRGDGDDSQLSELYMGGGKGMISNQGRRDTGGGDGDGYGRRDGDGRWDGEGRMMGSGCTKGKEERTGIRRRR